MEQRDRTVIVMYHANCNDGAGAAFAHWYNADSAFEYVYFPMDYPTSLENLKIDGKHLILLDYSFKRDVVIDVLDRVQSLLIIDHHESSKELLDIKAKNFRIMHNTEFSGAYLAWQYYSKEPVPRFIKYIDDRDCWKHQMPESKAFHIALQARLSRTNRNSQIFPILNSFMADHVLKETVEEGKFMLAERASIIESMILTVIPTPIKNVMALLINCPPILSSDTCHYILDKNPMAEVAGSFNVVGNQVRYSLRSKGLVDVSKIAESFGGGGHHNAAGFILDIEDSHLSQRSILSNMSY